MHPRILATLAVAIAVALATAVVAIASPGGKKKTTGHGNSVTVVEHATTDATTDTGASGDTVGDVLTFANDVYDAKGANKVGTDQGYCIRVVAGASYECNWTVFLPGGQITVQGPFYDAKDSTLAVTGGTGRYRNARGTMGLKSMENGAKYTFAYRLVG